MPSYAILGTTGNTGQSLLSILARSPSNQIHAYARSKAKLLDLSLDLGSAENVKIFEGDLHDITLISRCVAETRAVFLVIAVSDNVPNCTVAQDTARIVVAALEKLRDENPDTTLPKLVVLSSASIEPYLCRHMPSLVHWLLMKSSSHVYADLIEAEKFLRSQTDWITTTFVKPGGLVHDKQKGHKLSLEREMTFVSWMDLAAGMVEVADSDGQYDWKNVSVLPTANDVPFEWMAPVNLLKGLMLNYFPWIYHASVYRYL